MTDTLGRNVSKVEHPKACAATYLPEVLNDFVGLGVASVIGVLLPVVNIDISNTANQKLKFPLIEDVDQILWDEFVETNEESVELFIDTPLNTPLCNEAKAALVYSHH